jgi:UTP--glucose-1-phosphate uridylyltransferase
MTQRITKAVFPVAGMGTRFLPATKANPKEMLPIVDKPLVQYAAEEAIGAGMTQLVFVTSSAKRAIEDHFDMNYELEAELLARDKQDMLKLVQDILPKGVSCTYIRQPVALGLGHAVLCARPVVGDDPFAVILADDLIFNGSQGCLNQMCKVFGDYGSSVLGVEEVARSETGKYGIIEAERISNRLSRVKSIVEKPAPDKAPSTLAVVGRYVFTPRIFSYLENLSAGEGGEIQLTDAIAGLISEEEILAYEFEGIRYDCGSKLGYLQATVEYALRHPELKDAFRAYLREAVTEEGPEALRR